MELRSRISEQEQALEQLEEEKQLAHTQPAHTHTDPHTDLHSAPNGHDPRLAGSDDRDSPSTAVRKLQLEIEGLRSQLSNKDIMIGVGLQGTHKQLVLFQYKDALQFSGSHYEYDIVSWQSLLWESLDIKKMAFILKVTLSYHWFS